MTPLLLSLADYGHVTDAAAVLRVSQPTLSRLLARAEGELGTRLFGGC
jgi:DNA-binding transcriptional LysR family regulator